jgi:sodium-dependent dicarboxylate transporter 2/3/5
MADAANEDEGTPIPPRARRATALAGPSLGAAAWWLAPESLPPEARATLGLAAWMAAWWLTGVVPLAVTSLLPVLLLPLLGVRSFGQASAPYADPLVFLFAGGVTIARGLEAYGLSERLSGSLLRLAGRDARATLAALMLATALLSGFVSNTATAAMMLPIAIAMADAVERRGERAGPARARRNFGTAAVLGIAYAASIGGALTLIGSPPNAIAADFLDSAGRPVTFAGWLKFGVPMVCLLLPVAWYLLAFRLFPLAGLAIETDRGDRPAAALPRGAGPVATVFLATVAAWISRPLWAPPAVTDTTIALCGAIAMLTVPLPGVPYRPLLSWRDLRTMPWGVLILFGGGLSLAGAIDATGLARWIGESLSFAARLPEPALVLVVALAGTFASELASNTALSATVVPVLGAFAATAGLDPSLLVVPMVLGASLAFMMPVGTPPNAMAYATGRVSVAEMVKAGFWLNLVAAAGILVVVELATWLSG